MQGKCGSAPSIIGADKARWLGASTRVGRSQGRVTADSYSDVVDGHSEDAV